MKQAGVTYLLREIEENHEDAQDSPPSFENGTKDLLNANPLNSDNWSRNKLHGRNAIWTCCC